MLALITRETVSFLGTGERLSRVYICIQDTKYDCGVVLEGSAFAMLGPGRGRSLPLSVLTGAA